MEGFTGKLRWVWVAVLGVLIGCGGEFTPVEEAAVSTERTARSELLELVGSVTVSPEGTSLPLGEQHCVTATVRDLSAQVMANVEVDFVVAGANAALGAAVTDVNGKAIFCYSGSSSGQDTITASVGVVIDVVVHVWRAVSAIRLTPKDATHPVGQQHCVKATVLDTILVGMPGQNVQFTVAGAHTRSGSATTNLFGEAIFCYTGSVGGKDTITASVLVFSDTAVHTWEVINQGPWVDAGPDVAGYANASIALHGAAGDPDGDLLTVQWTYTVNAGTDATATCSFSNPGALTPTIRCTHMGSYTVKLTVTDSHGASISDTAQVHITNGSNVTICNMKRHTNKTTQRLCGYATPGKDGAPIVDVWFTVDNGEAIHAWPPTPENESAGFVDTATELTEGTHVIRMHALSADGNVTIRSQVVTVDITLPVLTIVSPQANATLSSTVVTVTSSVSDANAVRVVTQYQVGTDVSNGSGTVSHTIDLVNRGWQTILVRATDAAGNFVEARVRVYIE
jgi:hypothetical protein